MYYDIQCSPQDYLPCMFFMMKELETQGYRINSVCPLRTDIIPKHIRIDTTSLVHICLTEEQGTKEEFLTKGNLVRNQSKIWGFFFKTNKKCFHMSDTHKYTFDHMISTDGVSCSILLIKKELQGRSIFRFKPKKTPSTEKYIDELEGHEYTTLQEKKVVGVDPGLNDLIYCVNDDQKDTISKFRYSQNQRRQETKSKKYRDLILEWKKDIVGHQDVMKWETELSHYNKKTLDFGRFQDYIEKKNNMNFILQDFYQRYIFRKLKLGGYMRRQKTESMMMKRFKKVFGSSEQTIIAIGDFEQKQHRKFKEPIKGRGFRTLFRRHGYKVYLVDEHKTSCRCANCGCETTTFRWCKNPKYWKDDVIKRHGLLRCKNGCGLWNRDTNGAINIWRIAKEAILQRERPEYLKRTKRSISGIASIPTTQDLHEDPLTF
jgi:transposase